MKLHPFSIPLRALTKFQLRTFLIFTLGGGIAVGGGDGISLGTILGVVIGYIILLALHLVTAALYYQRFEYDLTDDTFDIASGIVSRRERNIPIRRIQNIDITQDIFARATGLAAVSLETAGGGSTDAEGEVRYVRDEEAYRLQNEIQRLKQGPDTATVEENHEETDMEASDTTEESTTADESDSETVVADDVLFELSTRNLFLVSILKLNLRPLAPVAVTGVAATEAFPGTQFSALWNHPGIGALIVAFATVVLGPVETFTRYYDFRLWQAGDELRYERGLVSRHTGSIPFEKIQNLIVNENVLMRRFGYATLDVETAGYGSRSAAPHGSESVVPLAEREAVLKFARSIEGFEFGDLDFSRPPKRARRRYVGRYVLAISALTGAVFVVSRFLDFGFLRWWFAPLALLLVVPFAAHYKWLGRGFSTVEEHALTRNGFWNRSIEVVPYYRVQTIIEDHTIFQRRWNLATVVIDTAGSSNLTHQGARAVDFDVETAYDLRETVRGRLRRSVIERRRERFHTTPENRSIDANSVSGHFVGGE